MSSIGQHTEFGYQSGPYPKGFLREGKSSNVEDGMRWEMETECCICKLRNCKLNGPPPKAEKKQERDVFDNAQREPDLPLAGFSDISLQKCKTICIYCYETSNTAPNTAFVSMTHLYFVMSVLRGIPVVPCKTNRTKQAECLRCSAASPHLPLDPCWWASASA